MSGAITMMPAPIEGESEIDDLVERGLLDELCQSLFALFGIPIRIISNAGTVFGVVAHEHAFCALINVSKDGRTQCRSTVDAVKENAPKDSDNHPCFTGLSYRIEPIFYEARTHGRIVIGPFAPFNLKEPSSEAKRVLAQIDDAKQKDALQKVPRAKAETVARVASHLKTSLDIILFSAHKTAVTSSTHLMSVQEGFRELTDKNRKLQDAYDRLKEADRLKSSFLATVSHELKTPLTSILGYSEMLSEGLAGPLADEQLSYVRTIYDKGNHLLAMITGLLDLSKLEIGTMRMKRENVRLFDIMGEVWTTLLPIAKKKGVTLSFDCAEESFEVRVDPMRIQQVFTNLVENAIKFTDAGGTIRISDMIFETEEAEDGEFGFALLSTKVRFLEVRVADTGLGIPEAERTKIFDAFYQVDSSSTREYGGTGLGLAIVKRVVNAHGGDVFVDANEPQGSVFVVRLPSADTPRPSIQSVALFDESPLP
jgi:two-component system, NarL family, sensor histidine kinase BarA